MTDAQARAAFEAHRAWGLRGYPARFADKAVSWEKLSGEERKHWYEVVQAVLDAVG